MKTFILASKNKHKAAEINEILGGGFNIVTQNEACPKDIDVIEDGDTFEANAIKKAEEICAVTGKPTIADDSGLCVDLLGGAPGVYTARFAGENATDLENIEKLLLSLGDAPLNERGAKFVCVIAFARPNEETLTFKGECCGLINLKASGDGGFGYDPVFYVPSYGKTMAELEPHIKNAISHRSDALKKFVRYIRKSMAK